MSSQLENIRAAYAELLRDVSVALRTQVGDAPRLQEVRRRALSLRTASGQVRLRDCSFHPVVAAT